MSTPETPDPRRWSQLALLASSVLLSMFLWFSATAVRPQLAEAWNLSGAQQAWLTVSVQLGFVVGALCSAVLNLSDRVPPPRLIAVSALAGALCNAAIVTIDDRSAASGGILQMLLLRGLTGVCLAGVYPPGMKLMASWFREERGLAIGILVGALTVGSASPHLLNVLPLERWQWAGFGSWRLLLLLVSASAAVGSLIAATCLRTGPLLGTSAPFDWKYVGRIWMDEPLRRANFGYLGHMWELYAMWAWTPAFLLAVLDSPDAARIWAFATIGIGGIGCVAAGRWADRRGRCFTAVLSLAVSGSCTLVAGFLGNWPAVAIGVCLIWGLAVVADSAQFSAAVSELCDSRYVGTALTVQTCAGFLLTTVSILLLPWLQKQVGWGWTFASLALGPAFGAYHMLRLRRMPEAEKMASGRA